ncbi:MAG: cytochrome c-type biogenesis protein [Solirubrobacterales bacterium]
MSTRRRSGLRLLLAGLLCALLLAPAGARAAEEPRTSLTDIEDEVMCPICGTLLGLSEAPQAERERVFIQRLIANGATKQEVKDALVAEYGPEVLAVPDTHGFDLAAWLVPGVGLVVAAGALMVAARRWRRDPGPRPSEGPALTSDDDERLRADMARYDL